MSGNFSPSPRDPKNIAHYEHRAVLPTRQEHKYHLSLFVLCSSWKVEKWLRDKWFLNPPLRPVTYLFISRRAARAKRKGVPWVAIMLCFQRLFQNNHGLNLCCSLSLGVPGGWGPTWIDRAFPLASGDAQKRGYLLVRMRLDSQIT